MMTIMRRKGLRVIGMTSKAESNIRAAPARKKRPQAARKIVPFFMLNYPC